ncbi:putative Cytochrome P450 [Seiridium cardinale]|uniref:Cytochrome P450 n=1 Tax=Seiridium cardinale TaxID=138064 RepID=A0ABR2XM67_9PEZI
MSSSLNIEHDFKQSVLSSHGLITLLVTFLVIYMVSIQRESYRSNFSKVKGIPEVPGALPFVGHIHLLGGRSGRNDATVFTEWCKKLNSPIVQCRLGDQRTIIVSDWAMIKDLWVGQSQSMIHRPPQPGFVEKLGVDLTGSPMTEQIRKCRAAAMKALGKVSWPRYWHLVEPSSAKLVRDVYTKGRNGGAALDTYAWLRMVSFDLALSLTYGARFGEVDDDFMVNFIKAINDISAVRSSTENYRHFVPLLRVVPESNSETIQAESRRAKHRDILMQKYHDRVAAGETVDCIVASLGADKLTPEEIDGTCLSLLQAAPDTVASGVYQTLAWLASPEGQPTQKQAYQDILDAYSGDRDAAWKMCFREDKVPLITSINKETLRQFTLTPYATPRRTNRDIKYKNMFFPEGITFIMNAQEANHDLVEFGEDAWEYKPDRYIGNDNPLPHLAFGAGVRICPAVAISNRLICAILTRIILAFDFREPEEGDGRKPNIDPIDFSDVYNQLVAHPRYYDAKFTARDEEWLERILAEEEI